MGVGHKVDSLTAREVTRVERSSHVGGEAGAVPSVEAGAVPS